MSKQTEAERMADYLDGDWPGNEVSAELRRLVSFNNDLMDEVSEQCRINGMSAEREDTLRAEVDRLNKALAAEREACAKTVEAGVLGHAECAAAIRARGNT